MFGTLIRRKQTQRPLGDDNIAFESTTFSLSTAVPKPAERRGDERLMAMLRVAKLIEAEREQLIRVRNVSAGGLMAEVGHPVHVGAKGPPASSSTRISTSASFWPVASHATASARARRACRSTARPM
jgi:hypothetical protein